MRQTWRQEGPAPSTLLERLLDKDIATERNELLQCVKYVCEKNFFGVGSSQKEQEQNTYSQPGSESEMLWGNYASWRMWSKSEYINNLSIAFFHKWNKMFTIIFQFSPLQVPVDHIEVKASALQNAETQIGANT